MLRLLQLLQLIIIIDFVVSLIPFVRNHYKKALKKTYIFVGVLFTLTNLIMLFYILPRTLKLLHYTSYSAYPIKIYFIQLVGLLLSVFLIVFGVKYKNFSKTNTHYYLLNLLLAILAIILIEIFIKNVIEVIINIIRVL